MQVAAVISSPAVTVGPEQTLHEAIGRMLEHRIGSLVVTDSALVGIITRSDTLRGAYHAGETLDSLPVSRAMSTDVVTTTSTRSVRGALETMADHNVKKLPVVDDVDLVGIVTLTDIAIHQPERVREVQQSLDRRDEWA